MDLKVHSSQFRLSDILYGFRSSANQEIDSDYNVNFTKKHTNHNENAMKKESKKVQELQNSNCVSDMDQCEIHRGSHEIETSKVDDNFNCLNKPNTSLTSNQYNSIDNHNYYNASTSSFIAKINYTDEESLNNSPNEKSMDHQRHHCNNNLYTIKLRDQPLVCLNMGGVKRLCLAQISSTLLKQYSYNEIHNRRVALGITCVQCTPSQLELLREAGAMPASSRRCGTITYREAERLIKSFLDEPQHPKLPENFIFQVVHHCGWGCQGAFSPSRYTSSRAKCIRCYICQGYFSPNKFIFHCHSPKKSDNVSLKSMYRHPDAANFNAWRRHLFLIDPNPPLEVIYAWEDVKAMFNGGNRKRSPLLHTNQTMSPPTTANTNTTATNKHKSIDDSGFMVNDLTLSSTHSLLNASNSKHYRLYSCTTNWSDSIYSNNEASSSSSSSSHVDDLDKSVKTHIQIDASIPTKKAKTEFMIENMMESQSLNNTKKRQTHKKYEENPKEVLEEYPKFMVHFQTDVQNNYTSHNSNIHPEKDFDKMHDHTSVNSNEIVNFNAAKHFITNSNTLSTCASLVPSQSYVDGNMTGYFLNTWPSIFLFKQLMYGRQYYTQLQGSSDSIMYSPFSSDCILNLNNLQRERSITNQIDTKVTSVNLISGITEKSRYMSQNDSFQSPLITSISASQ
ncbi:unnamed protein product [Schistosoma rodhaini]|uniref:c-SKI SMAD4-binding domain-containing protein n=1 Tax=Schistosoma rodhaini TaxID=6188 RepID=A0AA85G6L8_9TREM|nr:unnamed protein product [Schistosoma rodhaini]